MRRPDYLGIGAIKAGTTWAANALAAHPDIFMAHGKELHYFSDHYEQGEAWYLNHFSSAGACCSAGEYSVSYMDRSEETAQRVHDFNPDFRLIVSVRDPVERTFSQYRWMKQMGTEFPSLQESLEIHPGLVSNSCYAANLAPYWRRFPAGQFFYIRQVDIRARPAQVRRDLYRFLGVDPDFASKVPEQVVGETIQPRSRRLENLRIQLHHVAMRYGAGAVITAYQRLGLSKFYRRINNDPAAQETLSFVDREALAGLFQEDLKAFREHTGISVVEEGQT